MALTQIPSIGSMTLLSVTSLTGAASVTISNIDQSYNEIQIWGDNISSVDNNIGMRVNGSTSSIYKKLLLGIDNTSTGALETSLVRVLQLQVSTDPGIFRMTCKGYAETASIKNIINNASSKTNTGTGAMYNQNNFINVGAITSVTFFTADTSANFTAGTIKIYGVK